MAISLCDTEMVICNQFFLMDVVFFVVNQRSRGNSLLINLFLVHGKHDGPNLNPVLQCICKLQPF